MSIKDEHNENNKHNENLPVLLRKTTISISFVILVLGLVAVIALHHDIAGSTDEFVIKTVQRIESASQKLPLEQNLLGLQIANDFNDAFERMRLGAFLYELLIHLITAGFVAFIIIKFIESGIRKLNQDELESFRKKITDNVWQAVCSRLVPEEVTKQIEGVLQLNFVKENVRYVITLESLPGQLEDIQGEENEWVLLKRELSFSIRNISGRSINYPFETTILTTADKRKNIKIHTNNHHGFQHDQALQFPRHALLSIRGEEQTLEKPENPTINSQIALDPGDSCEISHTCFELLRNNDEAYYVQTVPLIGLDVTVRNSIPHRVNVEKVYLSHPDRKYFVSKPMQGNAKRYVFEHKAILPGQMFSVRWEEVAGEDGQANKAQTSGDNSTAPTLTVLSSAAKNIE